MRKISAHQIIPENILLYNMDNNVRLKQIEISPTDACNHQCSWCFTSENRTKNYKLSNDKLKDYILEFRNNGGLTVIISGGGEPLLFKNVYKQCKEFNNGSLLEFCISLGLNIGIITNGFLLDKVFKNIDIKKLCFIRVSLDSPNMVEHSRLHQCEINQSIKIINNIKYITDNRGSDFLPAIGVSFIVDKINSLNNDRLQIENIHKLAVELDVDFVQFKHVHTSLYLQAEEEMKKVHALCLEYDWKDIEFWVQKYLLPMPGKKCYVTELIQSLGNLNQRFPCCHLFGDSSFYEQKMFIPVGRVIEECPSKVCRYVSINKMMIKIKNREDTEKERMILQNSLREHGFHPYRLIPTAPDLIFPVKSKSS